MMVTVLMRARSIREPLLFKAEAPATIAPEQAVQIVVAARP
jgi:hypothetical protein